MSSRFSIDIQVNNVQAVAATNALSASLTQVHVQATMAGESADGMSLSFAGMGTAMMGLRAGVDILRAVGAGVADAREQSSKWADDLIKVRDSLRELAVLQGTGATTGFTLDQAEFARATRLTMAEAKAFRVEFMNEAAQFQGKSLKGKEFGEFERGSAALAAAKGFDPAEVAKLSGFLLRKDFSKSGDQGAEVALGELNRNIAILMRGSGANATLVGQAGRLMASGFNDDEMKGTFHDTQDVAVAISVAAEKSAAGAENLVRAAIRATSKTDDKFAGGLLKKAGITATTPFLERFDKLQPLIAAEAQAKHTTVDRVIDQHFHNIREAEGVKVFVNRGAGPKGAIADRLAFGRQFRGGDEAGREIAAFQGDAEGAGPAREAEAALEQARLGRGAEKARFATLMKQAEADLVRKKEIDTAATNVTDRLNDLNPAVWLGFDPGHRQQRIATRAQEMLRQRAAAAGVKLPDELTREFFEAGSGEAAPFNKAMDLIRKGGGNPLVDLGKKQDETNRLLRQIAGQQAKKPIPQAQPKAGAAHP